MKLLAGTVKEGKVVLSGASAAHRQPSGHRHRHRAREVVDRLEATRRT